MTWQKNEEDAAGEGHFFRRPRNYRRFPELYSTQLWDGEHASVLFCAFGYFLAV